MLEQQQKSLAKLLESAAEWDSTAFHGEKHLVDHDAHRFADCGRGVEKLFPVGTEAAQRYEISEVPQPVGLKFFEVRKTVETYESEMAWDRAARNDGSALQQKAEALFYGDRRLTTTKIVHTEGLVTGTVLLLSMWLGRKLWLLLLLRRRRGRSCCCCCCGGNNVDGEARREQMKERGNIGDNDASENYQGGSAAIRTPSPPEIRPAPAGERPPAAAIRPAPAGERPPAEAPAPAPAEERPRRPAPAEERPRPPAPAGERPRPPAPAAEPPAEEQQRETDQSRMLLLALFCVWLALFYCCLEKADIAVQTDKAEAEKLFQQSAAAGHWQSLFSLALIAQERGDVASASVHFTETVEAVAKLRYDKNQAVVLSASAEADHHDKSFGASKKQTEEELLEQERRKTEQVRQKQATVARAAPNANWTRLIEQPPEDGEEIYAGDEEDLDAHAAEAMAMYFVLQHGYFPTEVGRAWMKQRQDREDAAVAQEQENIGAVAATDGAETDPSQVLKSKEEDLQHQVPEPPLSDFQSPEKIDLPTAGKYLKRAADLQYSNAIPILASAYLRQPEGPRPVPRLVPYNEDAALHYFELAVLHGRLAARYNIAVLLLKTGRGELQCETLKHLLAVVFDMEPIQRMLFALAMRAHELSGGTASGGSGIVYAASSYAEAMRDGCRMRLCSKRRVSSSTR